LVLDQIWESPEVTRKHGHSGGERLKNDARLTFVASRWDDESSGSPEESWHLGSGDGGPEFNAWPGQRGELTLLGPVPDDEQARSWRQVADDLIDSLLRGQPAERQKVLARTDSAVRGPGEVRLHADALVKYAGLPKLVTDERADRCEQAHVGERVNRSVDGERCCQHGARRSGLAVASVNDASERKMSHAVLADAVVPQECRRQANEPEVVERHDDGAVAGASPKHRR
jgi:hypothetical protein